MKKPSFYDFSCRKFVTSSILQIRFCKWTIICPVDITEKVKTLCLKHKAPRTQAPGFQIPDFHALSPPFRREASDMSRRGGRGNRSQHEHMKVKVFRKDSFSLDKEMIDLRYVEQLADSEQTCALAYLLRYALTVRDNLTVQETVEHLTDLFTDKGWTPFCSSYVPVDWQDPVFQEIYACLNRFRGLIIFLKKTTRQQFTVSLFFL